METRGRWSPTSQHEFSGPRAAKLAGITYRRLDYWARKGFVEPSIHGAAGSGYFRLYSSRDVLALKVAKRLRQEGVSLSTIRKAVASLAEGKGTAASILTTYSFHVSGRKLLADRGDIVVDVTQSAQLMFTVALDLPVRTRGKAARRSAAQTKKPLARAPSRTSATLLDDVLHLAERRR